jgi:hypothetical protein
MKFIDALGVYKTNKNRVLIGSGKIKKTKSLFIEVIKNFYL